MNKIAVAVLLLLLAAFAVADTFYTPSGAVPDQFSFYDGDHALVLFGLFGEGQHGYFDLVDAMFVTRDDGTAFLAGILQRQGFPTQQFNVELEFINRHQPQIGMPVHELKPEAYVPLGPVDPSTWDFYFMPRFRIIGRDDFTGAEISIRPNRHMPEMQFGEGTTGKNVLMGFASWLKYLVKVQPDSGIQFSTIPDFGDWHVHLEENPGDPGCTHTQGYWKNHSEEWPVDNLFLGNVNYTDDQLLAILREPVLKDPANGLISLSHQLIAAKLNVADGADDTVVDGTIIISDALIGDLVVPPIGNGFLPPSDELSQLIDWLAAYNKGRIGPGHCPKLSQ